MAEGADDRRFDEVAILDKPTGDVVYRGGFEWMVTPKNEDEMVLVLMKPRKRSKR